MSAARDDEQLDVGIGWTVVRSVSHFSAHRHVGWSRAVSVALLAYPATMSGVGP